MANCLSLLVLAKTIHRPFQCQKHILKALKTLFQPQFLAWCKSKHFLLTQNSRTLFCVSSVYRVTSQPISLTHLFSMLQNLKSTCISKNTPLQVVFSTLFSVTDLWSNTVSHVWYITLNIFFSKMFSRDILVNKTTLWLKNSGTYWKRNSLLKSAYTVTKRYKTRDHQKMLRIMPRWSWVKDVYLSLVGGRFSLLW